MGPVTNMDALRRTPRLALGWSALELALSFVDETGDFAVPEDDDERRQLLGALTLIGWLRDGTERMELPGERWPWPALERFLVAVDGSWDRVIRPPDPEEWKALIRDYCEVGWHDLEPPRGEPGRD